MKRSYSYFVIKPDGMRFLDDICCTIEKRYQSVRYYAIDSYKDIIKKLYYKHYENKGEKFAKSFEAYLYGVTELFGDNAIMVLLADNTMECDELMQSVYNTKLEIRKKYVNNNIGIVTNHGDGEKNYIKIVNENGQEKSPRIMKELGNHRISDINIIHCPDPDKKATFKELDILLQQGIIDDRNMITMEMMQKMRKYRTAEFQNDMKLADYKGEITPDISGFIKCEIKRGEEEICEK